ncbi:pentapeptide repeat-containing protein [Glycomyces sp. NPDC048151]|uniref:pentapeptide repeat-containing protein n=1 Tax=Glycomyces sp. NPDC048151 TaxID=3364002 RepID=UPI0037249A1A
MADPLARIRAALSALTHRPRKMRHAPRRTVPLPVHVLIMVLAALSVLAVLLWLLTDDRTSPLSAVPTDQTILEVIRLAFYAVAGIGGVIALTVAYRKQRLSEAEVAREDAKLFNERFAAAAEQLSSERTANRLAGVYAMAALADEWDTGRQTCVNVLCAYLRMPYEPPVESAAKDADQYRAAVEERLVRHAVTDVIRERVRAPLVRGKTWHTCDFVFDGATLDSADFSKASFLGRVSFFNARFPTGAVNFSGAYFRGDLNFRQATVSGGILSFTLADFGGSAMFAEIEVTGGRVDFQKARFPTFSTWFFRSKFSGGTVDFDGAYFQGHQNAIQPDLRFTDAEFSGAAVSFRQVTVSDGALDFTGVKSWTHPPICSLHHQSDKPGLLLPENTA